MSTTSSRPRRPSSTGCGGSTGTEASTLERELEQIIAQWVVRAEEEPDLVYANPRHPDKALLGDAGLAGEDFQSTFPTLWSLRDVDLSSNLYQVM